MTGMLAIAVSSVLYMNVLGLGLGSRTPMRHASVVVPDSDGLTVGSKVLLRGIAIGDIEALNPSATGVEVRWKYQDSYRIPDRSRLRIDNLSALGETYLAVLPATEHGPYLADHAVIPPEQITVPTTVQELSARLTRLLDQVHPDQLRTITDELHQAFPKDGVVLVDLSRAWSLISETTTSRADDLTAFLTNFQALLADSSWLPTALSDMTGDMRKTGVGMGSWVNASADALDIAPLPGGLITGTGPFIAQLQNFLDKAAPDLKVLALTVTPAVQAAAAAIRTVDIGTLLDNAIANSVDGAIAIHVSVPH
ncbi:MlaD family protein [Nocardia nepalensis]|uniref:MlaD family protein n=1 Tax=Nocardia nepalensis TaxID=3375448 RepID=UPI003B67DEAD